MRMYYIGIAGATSPLAQAVIAKLQANSALYQVAFLEDATYPSAHLASKQFSNVSTALAQTEDLDVVIDFGPTETALERAAYYRYYCRPAIMCATFSAIDIEEYCLQNNLIAKTDLTSPLLLVPDYSIAKVLMIKNLKEQAQCFAGHINRIYVDISHNTNPQVVHNQWLYWVRQINALLGEYTDHCQKHDNGTADDFSHGFVRITAQKVPTLDENDELVRISMMLDDKGRLKWESLWRLQESRVEGALSLLDWFLTSRYTAQELILREIVMADFVLLQ